MRLLPDPGAMSVPNELLAALPPADLQRLMPAFDVVSLPPGDILNRWGEPIEYVYFPGGGFCSELTVLPSGEMVEVATIGREGMVGIFGSAKGEGALSVSMVQAAMDTCFRLSAAAFRDEMDTLGSFYHVITRFGRAHLRFLKQSTACNAVHPIEQRFARWLLIAHDHVGADTYRLTQEFIATMLGTHLAAVPRIVRTLGRAGLIDYRHEQLTILDRQRLEAASCECYRVTADLRTALTFPHLSTDEAEYALEPRVSVRSQHGLQAAPRK